MPKRAASEEMDWYTEAGPNLICTVCDCKLSRGNIAEHEAGRRHQDNLRKLKKHSKSFQRNPPQPPARQPNAPPAAPSGPNLEPKRQCATCTLLNDPSARSCAVCGDPRLPQMPVVHVTMGSGQTNVACPGCGANSPVDAPRCFICGYDLANVGTVKRNGAAAAADDDDVVVVQRPRGRQPPPAPVTVADDDVVEDDECLLCMARRATHGFVPCGHIVMCEGCAKNFTGTRECFTCRQKVQQVMKFEKKPAAPTRRGLQSSHSTALSGAPSTTAASTRGGPAHGMDANPARNWQHVGSTFPWIGGESAAWPRFVREIESAAAAYVKLELGARYPQAHVKRCHWSPALAARLKEGWCQHACPEGAWAGAFGWHGSKKGTSAINAIAQNGWDPATRSRNAHGPGDYFAVHHSQAIEYSLDAGRKGRTQHGDVTLLLAFVLRGDHLSWVEDYCMICNNPADQANFISFSFPMYVVHFTKHDPPNRWLVPRFPYRWQFGWEQDQEPDEEDDEDDTTDDDYQQPQRHAISTKASQYHAYDHGINQRLNEAMCRYYARQDGDDEEHHLVEYTTTRQNPSTHVLESTTYEVNLQTLTQTNLDTQFMRKINIQCVPPTSLPRTLWMILRDAAEIDRIDAEATRGANRHRHDYARNTSNVPDDAVAAVSVGGGTPRPDPTAQQFWLVLDMFSQRELSAGFFKYNGQPCPRTGQTLPSRRNPSARLKRIAVHGAMMLVDFDRMVMKTILWDDRNQRETVSEPGWPLAVVNA